MRGHDGDAQTWALDRLTASEGIDPGLEGIIGRQGQVEALIEAVGVQAEEATIGVEDRPTR